MNYFLPFQSFLKTRRRSVFALFFLALVPFVHSMAFAESKPFPYEAYSKRAFEFYKSGEIQKAREAFAEAVQAIHHRNDRVVWKLCMEAAWFEQQVGNHKAALDYSNRALEIAEGLGDGFMRGRSLAWLGWAFSDMGLYQPAVETYRQAIEIGAPKGKIRFVAVWGLATQELGSVFFKMGDINSARILLNQTLDYARKYKIDVGIAEGGTHLAEFELKQENYQKAFSLAHEALEASKRCGCSPLNTARALFVKAKVAHQFSVLGNGSKDQAWADLRAAQKYAEAERANRIIAECKILESQLLDDEEYQKRFELLEEAYKILSESESELRGDAEAALGHDLLDTDRTDLAQFYIKRGLQVNAEMLRKIENSTILMSLSELAKVEGNGAGQLSLLDQSIQADLSTGSLLKATSKLFELLNILDQRGYYALAQKWTDNGIAYLTEAQEKALGGPPEKLDAIRFQKIEEQLIRLMERRVHDFQYGEPPAGL